MVIITRYANAAGRVHLLLVKITSVLPCLTLSLEAVRPVMMPCSGSRCQLSLLKTLMMARWGMALVEVPINKAIRGPTICHRVSFFHKNYITLFAFQLIIRGLLPTTAANHMSLELKQTLFMYAWNVENLATQFTLNWLLVQYKAPSIGFRVQPIYCIVLLGWRKTIITRFV